MTDPEPLLGIRKVLRDENADRCGVVYITAVEPLTIRGYTGDDECFRCRVEHSHHFEILTTDEVFATRRYLETLPREDVDS